MRWVSRSTPQKKDGAKKWTFLHTASCKTVQYANNMQYVMSEFEDVILYYSHSTARNLSSGFIWIHASKISVQQSVTTLYLQGFSYSRLAVVQKY
jgi:hypothetical protein